MSLPKVFIADSISQRGIDELARDGALGVSVQTGLSETDLAAAIPDFAALIVRSQTKVTSKILNAAKKLRVVGRAGVGVDNVDVETATRRGVDVLNAPGANTISTAEHTFSLLLSLTRHILNAERLPKTKRGVRIINCARGGLIDEQALADAISNGHVAGAALDVFEKEPLPADSLLRKISKLVLTPHLGASTAEAQESVGIEIAQSVRAALLEGTIRNAVNMPTLDAKTLALIGPHLRFGEKLGRFLSQLAPRRVDSLNINYSGKVNEVDTTAITRAVLKGFLQSAGGSEVNEVNAPAFSESPGVKITETRLSAPGDYSDMLELSASAEGKNISVGGAFFGVTPRIVSINARPVEARPQGVILVLENTDRPGMVGRIGTLLGQHGVNIATMSLSRNQAGGTALTVLNLDSAPGEELLKEIGNSDDIRSAQVIQL